MAMDSDTFQQLLDTIERFVREICGCEARWEPGNIIADAIARVREQVGSDKVLLGLSGGVDSSVVAALLHRAIGDQLVCVFVDHGLLRAGEGDQVWLVALISGLIFAGGLLMLRLLQRRPRVRRPEQQIPAGTSIDRERL